MKTTRLALLSLLAFLAAVPTAGAATFCVDRTPCPDGGTAQPSLTQALVATNANPDADTIYLGPGTYGDGPFTATQPVSIVGAGRDATSLTRGNTDPNQTILMLGALPSSVSDLTIQLNAGDNLTGLDAQVGATASNLAVRGTALSQQTGITGGTVSDFVVDMPVGGSGTGVVHGTLSRGTVAASLGIAGGVTAQALKVTARTGVGPWITGSAVTLDDVLLELRGPDPIGIDASGGFLSSSVTARHVTAHSTEGGVAIRAMGFVGFPFNPSATAVVRDSVFTGFATSYQRQGSSSSCFPFDIDPVTPGCQGGSPTSAEGNITVSYSRVQGTPNDTGGPGAITTTNTDTIGDPRYVNAGAGDFRPAFDSPLVDQGDPAPPAGEPATDLAGIARIVNNRSDIGAYEYGRRAPVAQASVSPLTLPTGSPFAFSSAGSNDPDGDPLTFGWAFGDGATASGATASHAFAKAGSYTATLTATDPVGLQATATAKAAVAAKAPTKSKPKRLGVSVKPKRDRVAPYRFRVSGKLALPAGVAKSACGKTKVTITLRHAKKRGVKKTKKVRLKKCGYSATLGTKTPGKYKVRVKFPGNSKLRSRSSKTIGVRAG